MNPNLKLFLSTVLGAVFFICVVLGIVTLLTRNDALTPKQAGVALAGAYDTQMQSRGVQIAKVLKCVKVTSGTYLCANYASQNNGAAATCVVILGTVKPKVSIVGAQTDPLACAFLS